MARSLSQTLILKSRSLIISRPPPLTLAGARLRSGIPEAGKLLEIDLGADGAGVEVELLSVRRLEEAIQSYVIKKAAPGWIAFAPGASYWVPPGSRGLGEADAGDGADGRVLAEELRRGRRRGGGWPSSSFFFEGGGMPEFSSQMFIKDMTEAQSDDED